MADIRKLTENLSVASQLSPADIAEIGKAKQFASILCNRPDLEQEDQPAFEQIKALAEKEGLVVEFQPVNGAMISDADVDEFEQHIANMPKPVLAYCRSGTRCSVLWALSQAGVQSVDDILKTTSAAGYELDPLRPRIIDRE